MRAHLMPASLLKTRLNFIDAKLGDGAAADAVREVAVKASASIKPKAAITARMAVPPGVPKQVSFLKTCFRTPPRHGHFVAARRTFT